MLLARNTAPKKLAKQRATVLIAVVIALVVLQLAVVGTTLMGARQQTLTVNSLDGVRAYYAAEAGLAMAMREVAYGVDYDADGTVGSISADSNDSADPTIGSARVVVTKSVSGYDQTYTSTGRKGAALSKLQMVVR